MTMGARALHQHASRTTSHESIIARCGRSPVTVRLQGCVPPDTATAQVERPLQGTARPPALSRQPPSSGRASAGRVLDMPLYGERRTTVPNDD